MKFLWWLVITDTALPVLMAGFLRHFVCPWREGENPRWWELRWNGARQCVLGALSQTSEGTHWKYWWHLWRTGLKRSKSQYLMEMAVYICILFKFDLKRGMAYLTVSQLWWNWRCQLHLKSFGFSQKYRAVLRRKVLLVFWQSSDEQHISEPALSVKSEIGTPFLYVKWATLGSVFL